MWQDRERTRAAKCASSKSKESLAEEKKNDKYIIDLLGKGFTEFALSFPPFYGHFSSAKDPGPEGQKSEAFSEESRVKVSRDQPGPVIT